MSTGRATFSAALGLMAGIVAAAIGTSLTPEFPVTVAHLFVRAVLLLGFVFAAGFIATYAGCSIRGETRIPQAWQISIGAAMTVVWLLPLLMFALQQSWLVAILWAVFLFHVARFGASIGGQLNQDPSPVQGASPSPAFSVLRRDFPFGSAILGALLVQSSLFAAIAGYYILAGISYLCGTTAIGYRTFQMFRAGPYANAGMRERIAPVLGTVTLLTVFAWLPATSFGGPVGSGLNGGGGPLAAGGQSGRQETGKRKSKQERATTLDWLKSLLPLSRSNSHADSFAFAKRIFDSKFPSAGEQAETGTRAQRTGIPNREPGFGPVFPGVELYPETAHRTKLVAPPPQRRSGFGAAHSDPLSIPFDGVYWFWKGPSEGPPPNAAVIHGSPSARFFRATDHEIMSMEAHENFGFAIDTRAYGAIEILLENVDPFPNTVSIALHIRDSIAPAKRPESLGIQKVSGRGGSADHAATQILRFSIPASSRMGKFDELVVTYYLRGERSDRSARIAIQGFRLVPRAG